MCHGLQVALKARLSKDQWSAIVDDMAGRGAQGTDDEFELVVKYLAANFGPKAEGGESKDASGQKIEINNATAAELASGLGIAETDARAIVAYRNDHGAFKEMADLAKVSGIDLKKLESLKDRIVFSPAAPVKK
jgi:competence protein ComEA